MPKLGGVRPKVPTKHAFLPDVTEDVARATSQAAQLPASLKRALNRVSGAVGSERTVEKTSRTASSAPARRDKLPSAPNSAAEAEQMQRILSFDLFQADPIATILAHQDQTAQLRKPTPLQPKRAKLAAQRPDASVIQKPIPTAPVTVAAQPTAPAPRRRRTNDNEIPMAVERVVQKPVGAGAATQARTRSASRKAQRKPLGVTPQTTTSLEAAMEVMDEMDALAFPRH